jgi:spoIIIJ-associated protein
LILSLILNHQTDQWYKIIVNVGDYRQRREATLSQLAKNAAQRVAFSGEPYVFDSLSPSERRVVHLALQDNPQVTTYSQGDGRNRQLVVALK